MLVFFVTNKHHRLCCIAPLLFLVWVVFDVGGALGSKLCAYFLHACDGRNFIALREELLTVVVLMVVLSFFGWNKCCSLTVCSIYIC